MLEKERERGKKIAHLSSEEKNELVAQLMFGQHWREAREALIMLLASWGIGVSIPPDTQGGEPHE